MIRKYWYLVKKTSRGPLVYSNSLIENAYSYVNKEWHHSNIDYIQKPPSAEPWGSRGAGPIVTLDRGALP